MGFVVMPMFAGRESEAETTEVELDEAVADEEAEKPER